jgi:hypothetical protein
MNITNIKTDLVVYHDAKDVAIALKSRNIGALGAGLTTLLAALLPILQPLGAAHGLTIDDATMGYVRSLLLGIAGLFLAPHLKPGPPVAVVTGNGPIGGSAAPAAGPVEARVQAEPSRSDDPARDMPLGG